MSGGNVRRRSVNRRPLRSATPSQNRLFPFLAVIHHMNASASMFDRKCFLRSRRGPPACSMFLIRRSATERITTSTAPALQPCNSSAMNAMDFPSSNRPDERSPFRQLHRQTTYKSATASRGSLSSRDSESNRSPGSSNRYSSGRHDRARYAHHKSGYPSARAPFQKIN